MANTLKYKNFIGTVEYNSEDKLLTGKLMGIPDLVSYHGVTVSEIEASFKDAIDDYLDYCEREGKETTQSCGGIFNVRVSPYIHLKALERSKERGITLNKYIRNALERDLSLEK